MPSHWTYATECEGDLQQGDFLAPAKPLLKVLEVVHPHFSDPKYVGFLVTTQTCDLVRRGGAPPKARHVNIAAVRSLRQVLPSMLATACKPVAERVFRKSTKTKAHEFLRRVVNQNEEALGLFYLHDDADLELGDPSVAYLRVSIALRAQHYDVLTDARRGRLRSEYQARLGWLLGNLFARPAASDWSEQTGSKQEENSLVKQLLGEHRDVLWVDDAALDAAKKAGLDITSVERACIEAELRRHRPPKPIDEAVSLVSQVTRDVVPGVTDRQLRRLQARLRNEPRLRALLALK